MCKHSVGLLYQTGALEVTSEVRSVPLGAKRKRGRPKQIPNCLVKSPIRIRPELILENDADTDENSDDIDVVETEAVASTVPAPKKTTRKRKKCQLAPEVQQTPVEALLNQSRRTEAGLGASKPPKKRSRIATKASNPNLEVFPPPTNQAKPPPIKCKKKKGTCSHEVVFGEHFDQQSWNKYAESIRSKKSTVEIDPNYVP